MNTEDKATARRVLKELYTSKYDPNRTYNDQAGMIETVIFWLDEYQVEDISLVGVEKLSDGFRVRLLIKGISQSIKCSFDKYGQLYVLSAEMQVIDFISQIDFREYR